MRRVVTAERAGWVALVAFALWFGPAQAGDRKWLDLGVEAMVLAGAATGVNVLVGRTGLLSLGHAGFAVAGGYAGALLGPYLLGDGSVLPAFVVRNGPWFGPVFAAAAGALLGTLVALACCHLRGFHLTAVTLAAGALVPVVAVLAAGQLGGLGGRAVERLPDTRNAFLARDHALAGVYYTAVAFLLVSLWLARNLGRSRWGRALAAVRDGEAAAAASGIDPYRHKVGAFAVSAALVGVAGWVTALRTLAVSPGSALDVQTESFRYVIVVALGGAGTLAGPVVGAFVVTFGLGLDLFQDHVRDRLGLVFGGLALAVVALAPGGLVGVVGRVLRGGRTGRRGRYEGRPAPDVPGGKPLVVLGPPAGDEAILPAGNETPVVPVPPAGAGIPRLQVEGVARSFGGVAALAGVDLEVGPGQVHAVVGPNGSGKSTLVDVVAGAVRPTAGRVLLDGQDVTALPAHRRAALGVARTFQGVRVWPRMTVLDNVLAGAHVRGSTGLVRGLLGLGRVEERRQRSLALAALAAVGLGDRAGDPAGSLNLPERRRLELARALAARPRLVLLDEPAAGLDPAGVARIAALVRDLAAAGAAVVLVEHRLTGLLELAGTVTVLHQGTVLVRGTPEEVVADPRVREVYLGAAAPEASGAVKTDEPNTSDR